MRKLVLTVLVFLVLFDAKDVIAQAESPTAKAIEVSRLADKILEQFEQHEVTRTEASVYAEKIARELNADKKQYEKLRSDFSKLNVLLKSAGDAYSVTVSGKDIPVKRLIEWRESTLDHLSRSEDSVVESRELTRMLKALQEQLESSEQQSLETVKDFNAVLETYRGRMSRELALDEFNHMKLKSKLALAKKFRSHAISLVDAKSSSLKPPMLLPSKQMATKKLRSVAEDLRDMADKYEKDGHKEIAEELRQKAAEIVKPTQKSIEK